MLRLIPFLLLCPSTNPNPTCGRSGGSGGAAACASGCGSGCSCGAGSGCSCGGGCGGGRRAGRRTCRHGPRHVREAAHTHLKFTASQVPKWMQSPQYLPDCANLRRVMDHMIFGHSRKQMSYRDRRRVAARPWHGSRPAACGPAARRPPRSAVQASAVRWNEGAEAGYSIMIAARSSVEP